MRDMVLDVGSERRNWMENVLRRERLVLILERRRWFLVELKKA